MQILIVNIGDAKVVLAMLSTDNDAKRLENFNCPLKSLVLIGKHKASYTQQ
jgi:hypothetical protein